MYNKQQLETDIKFLLSFAPAQDPDEVEDNLMSMFYITLTYEGDIELAKQVKEIRTRYNVTIDDADADLV